MAIFMTATLVMAIACGIVTYRIAVREARREIDEAFLEHIKAMHAAHREFIEEVVEVIEHEKKD